MTRKEVVGKRPLDFSKWIREKLPDSSTGYSASDLDFILWNWKTNKIMLLELKTRKSYPRTGQRIMWNLLHRWINKGLDDTWTYYGFHLIQFENSSFLDGKCYLDKKEIQEKELIDFLSFN